MGQFVYVVNNRNQSELEALFDTSGEVIQFPPYGASYSVKNFFDALEKGSTIKVTEVTPASWYTSCIFEITGNKHSRKGIAFFKFNPGSRKISSVRFYWE